MEFRIDLLMLALLPFLASLGAWFSKQLKSGRDGFFFLLPANAVLTGSTWAVIAKFTRMPLTAATILFDIIYSLSYFFALVAMGEQFKPIHGLGVGFALVAMVLLSL